MVILCYFIVLVDKQKGVASYACVSAIFRYAEFEIVVFVIKIDSFDMGCFCNLITFGSRVKGYSWFMPDFRYVFVCVSLCNSCFLKFQALVLMLRFFSVSLVAFFFLWRASSAGSQAEVKVR